jgi:hypothetical protein
MLSRRVRIQVLSDLNLERGERPPHGAGADVVVLAGDIGPGAHGLRSDGLVARASDRLRAGQPRALRTRLADPCREHHCARLHPARC